MKNLIVFILLSMLSIGVFAQSDSTKTLHFSGIDVSSGKGAISSGLYGYLNMEGPKNMLQMTLSVEDLEITYLYRLFKDKLLIGPNAGYFYNVPYAGPYIIFSPIKFISTFHWVGYSCGKPEGIFEIKPEFLFAANSVSLNVWRTSVTYCLINYLDNSPQHTVDIKYTQNVTKNFSIYTYIGWDFKNKNQMLKLGVNWKK